MIPTPLPLDFILPFQFRDLGIRGRLVRLGTVADTVLRTHAYPELVGELLAQALSLSAILAGALKFDGIFTLQTKGDGPVSMLVADTTSAGEMRGYANFNAERLRLAAGSTSAPVPRLLGAGFLAFTVDQGPHTERYQGIVELHGATLADCAHRYLRQSEQIESGIRIAAHRRPDDGHVPHWAAAALMLQRLPELGGARTAVSDEDSSAENWRRVLALMSSVTDAELLDPNLGPYDLLHRLFHEEKVNVSEMKPLLHRCRCSELRVQRALASIPEAELEDLKVHGKIEVTCEFCNASYVFDDAVLRRFRAAG